MICRPPGSDRGQVPSPAAAELHRELRNNSSAILRAVQAGESFEITNHGEVVALLVPPGAPRPLPIRPARVRGDFTDLPRVQLDHPVQEDLDFLRGDR